MLINNNIMLHYSNSGNEIMNTYYYYVPTIIITISCIADDMFTTCHQVNRGLALARVMCLMDLIKHFNF